MDGMTIDEVIKYFDDDAKENAKLAIIYRGNDDDLAEMHKQDANRSAYVSVWLRELKAYREAEEEIDRKRKSGQWSEAVVFGMSRALLIMRRHIMEVNADEDSD